MKRNQKRKGAVAVEFAIILPVFMALVVGAFSIGWALHYRQVCINSAGVAGVLLAAGESDETAATAAQQIADTVGGVVEITPETISVSAESKLFKSIPVAYSQPAIRPAQ